MNLNRKNLIIDASNLLYRNFFIYSKDKDADEILIGMCNLVAFKSMRFYYNKYKPDNIIMVFDSHSWRKMYTSDLSACVTGKKYKGNRRQKISTSEAERLAVFDEHVNDFHDLLKTKTKILTLKAEYLEADDLIAGVVKHYPDDENIIISADKDFIQLLRNPNVSLIDPLKNKPRTLDEWDGDADLFMFEKCIRGDTSDNVQSSYPRIRKTKIIEAYNDDFVRENIMKHTFEITAMDSNNTPINESYVTEDLFEENELLMDLTMQPKIIKKIIKKNVKKCFKKDVKFDKFNFMRFCVKCGMENIIKDIDSLSAMLSNKKFN